jgi:nucleotide-binding universal stress UspA family protein
VLPKDRLAERDVSAIETVAVGTDGSDTAANAVSVAIDIAASCGARLLVASAYEPVSEGRVAKEQEGAPQEVQWSINPTEDVEAVLREAEDRAKARGLHVTAEARVGAPARVLCQVAEDHEADLLVVGTKGMHRRHLRSVPNDVSHSAPCSVLIVKTV